MWSRLLAYLTTSSLSPSRWHFDSHASIVVVVVMVHELQVVQELRVVKELLVVEYVDVQVVLVSISTLAHHVRASIYCVLICLWCCYAMWSTEATFLSCHYDCRRACESKCQTAWARSWCCQLCQEPASHRCPSLLDAMLHLLLPPWPRVEHHTCSWPHRWHSCPSGPCQPWSPMTLQRARLKYWQSLLEIVTQTCQTLPRMHLNPHCGFYLLNLAS